MSVDPSAIPPESCAPLTAVVLAKAAVPGRVKTRLTRGPRAVSPDAAAEIHAAMLQATLDRIQAFVAPGPRLLAMDDPELAPDHARSTGWDVTDQGDGNLGDRMARLWTRAGDGPVVFFGVDCPDVPARALAAVGPGLSEHDAAAGPVEDGGYWTLAAAGPHPRLLAGIDWGTGAVYDQTRAAASQAGLRLAALPGWFDVDHPEDLVALRARLATPGVTDHDPALSRLARAIERLTVR